MASPRTRRVLKELKARNENNVSFCSFLSESAVVFHFLSQNSSFILKLNENPVVKILLNARTHVFRLHQVRGRQEDKGVESVNQYSDTSQNIGYNFLNF